MSTVCIRNSGLLHTVLRNTAQRITTTSGSAVHIISDVGSSFRWRQSPNRIGVICSFSSKAETRTLAHNDPSLSDSNTKNSTSKDINIDSLVKRVTSDFNYAETASLYVHWPYCRRRCTYCDFVKFVPKEGSSWTFQDDVLEEAMVRETQQMLRASHVKHVTSVFFGGGTPSMARPQLVERILQAVRSECEMVADAEVSLEGNPSSLPKDKMAAFISAGVNRISIGIQSLDDVALRSLGRDHTAAEALRCLAEARAQLPGRVSLDLLFARPGQTTKQWRDELRAMLRVCDDHISLYQLTVERGTPLYRQVKAGSVEMPTSDVQAEMYEDAVSMLAAAGFTRYEVSNFARTRASESNHNKNYWRAGQYLGVGPGAHSRVVPQSIGTDMWSGRQENRLNTERGNLISNIRNEDSFRDPELGINNDNVKNSRAEQDAVKHIVTSVSDVVIREERVNTPDPAQWLSKVRRIGNGAARIRGQSRRMVAEEYIVVGLRTVEGLENDRWRLILPDVPLRQVFADQDIKQFLELNVLNVSDGNLKPTDKGINVIDLITPDLLNILKEKLK